MCRHRYKHNEDVHLTVPDGLTADHEAAVRAWRAANVARLLPPSVGLVCQEPTGETQSQAGATPFDG